MTTTNTSMTAAVRIALDHEPDLWRRLTLAKDIENALASRDRRIEALREALRYYTKAVSIVGPVEADIALARDDEAAKEKP